jgi:bifunctional N-acetylglucosamine-1-phosphate-uridyltransferase/glucosamine-1-phosphate-acetyltransferase GlmU-like protein
LSWACELKTKYEELQNFFVMNLAIVVLAAGKGTRMDSDLAKVLHPLCGKPLVHWVLEAVAALQPQQTVVVVGHQAEVVEAAVRDKFPKCAFAVRKPMLGTGHARAVRAKPTPDTGLSNSGGDIIVLCGDAPLVQSSTLHQLVQMRRDNNSAATMMVAQAADPGSYGRVLVDDQNRVSRIVEAKDASPEELAVKTVNAGTYCFRGRRAVALPFQIEQQQQIGRVLSHRCHRVHE